MKLALAVVPLAVLVPSIAHACEAPGRPCPVVVCDDGTCDSPDDDPAPPPVRIAPAPPQSGCDAADCGAPAKARCEGKDCDAAAKAGCEGADCQGQDASGKRPRTEPEK